MATRLVRTATALLLALVLSLAAISGPAAAHRNEVHEHPERTSRAAPAGQTARMEGVDSQPMHGERDRSQLSFGERLLDWLGRLHPFVVHFPIGFFPAALLTAVVGRRRPGVALPVQFLVIAGGILAPIAAAFGWLNAMTGEPDPLLTVHRWLGTAIAIASVPLAVWAWRRPDQDRSRGMIVALSVLTAAVLVQGWYGAALVHGPDHLNW